MITPAILFAAFIVGCLVEEPPRPRPQPTDSDGKEDNGEQILGETPLPGEEGDTCGGESEKRADGDCLPAE